MESRMRRKSHVRFGERDGANRNEKSVYGGPVPTLRVPEPSPEDVLVTREIVAAGVLLDVEVLDHLVIGQGRFVSLRERGLGFAK
jgi:DNA repair protein RadC